MFFSITFPIITLKSICLSVLTRKKARESMLYDGEIEDFSNRIMDMEGGEKKWEMKTEESVRGANVPISVNIHWGNSQP